MVEEAVKVAAKSGGAAHVRAAEVVVHEASEATLARVGRVLELHRSVGHLDPHRVVAHLVRVARLIGGQVERLALVVKEVGALRDVVLGEQALALVLRVQDREVPTREKPPAHGQSLLAQGRVGTKRVVEPPPSWWLVVAGGR